MSPVHRQAELFLFTCKIRPGARRAASGRSVINAVNYSKNQLRYRSELARVWWVDPAVGQGQQLLCTDSTVAPVRSYVDRQANHIHYAVLRNPPAGFTVNYKLRLSQVSPPSVFAFRRGGDPEARRWLRDERFLRQSRSIVELATRVGGLRANRVEQLHRVFRYVASVFSYASPVRERGVERLDLKSPKGDCGEMSALFVTLCRALGIPARPETGFVLVNGTAAKEHAWASVRHASGSWYDIDTQYASLEASAVGADMYFLRRPDLRVSFSRGYNLPLRPAVPVTYDLSASRRVGLPVTHESIQLLQPAVLLMRRALTVHPRMFVRNCDELPSWQ